MKDCFLPILFLFTNIFSANEHLVNNITSREFEKEILQACLPVFFQISVSWCPPCKLLKTIFEELSVEFKDEAVFVEIDVAREENRDILQTILRNYDVMIGGFPIIFVFNQGKYIEHFYVRTCNKEELVNIVNVSLKKVGL